MSVNSVKDDEEEKESIKGSVLIRLLKYLLEYKKQIIAVILLILFTVGAMIVYPLLIKKALDDMIPNNDIKGLLIIVLIALILTCLYFITSRIWRKIMAKLSNDVLVKIRENLYEHIQTLSFSFFDSRPTGKILARVIGDVNSLKDVISSTITQLIPETITIIAVLVMMIVISPALTVSALAAIPLIVGGLFLAEIVAHKRWMIFRKKNSNLTAFIHETFSGIGVVQSFTAEEETEKEFNGLVEEHITALKNAILISDLFSPTIEISFGVGSFLLYFIGIKVLGVGHVGIGTFTAFAMYLSMFWGPLRNLAGYYNKLITNISAAERIFEILDMEPDVSDTEGAVELPEIEGNVKFEHVSFAYPDEPDNYILHDVNIDIHAGETIALVGQTGAGKTTIVNLISRFYNATEGKIKIDGYDLMDVTIKSLRKQMGVMTQDNYLFSGTIKDNIKYGKLDATDEEIEKAAKAVHAHEFIMQMEKGYDTEISERGARLSIGQRQLLAFARTMVSDPRILILDEATSSIDTNTEIIVQRGIESLLKNRTSFVIAHRLSTIKNADRIFVIDDGGILEAGNHEELMKKEGAYYNLYKAQFKNI